MANVYFLSIMLRCINSIVASLSGLLMLLVAVALSTIPTANFPNCFVTVKRHRSHCKRGGFIISFGVLYFFFFCLVPFFFFLLFPFDQPKPLNVRQSIALWEM